MKPSASLVLRLSRLGIALGAMAAPLAALAAGSPAEAGLQPPPEARAMAEKLRGLAATASADGSIRVSGEGLDALDRMALIRFAADVRSRLEQLTDAVFKGRFYGIALLVQAAEAERPASASLRLAPPSAEADGSDAPPAIRIVVANLPKLDPRDLACTIADGLVRMKVVEAAGGGTALQPPPRWFAEGLAHYLETVRRQDDSEAVLGQWQQAALPPLGKLAAAQSPYAAADRRVAAQLAAYWLDFPDRGPRFDRLCRALASGEPWSAGLFAETSSGLADLAKADADFDGWLLARRATVLTPGATRREFVVRAWCELLLDPGEDGAPADVPPRSSPALLLERIGEPWAPVCARAKARKLMALSAGRGTAFREAAAAWAAWFEGVARGESKAKLAEALPKAERLLRDSATTAVP